MKEITTKGSKGNEGNEGKRERPILFSGAMVRAILEGRKTQTRRVGKTQGDFKGVKAGCSLHATRGKVIIATHLPWPDKVDTRHGICECPYGAPGDRLWVKETWGTLPGWDDIRPADIPVSLDASKPAAEIYYRADGAKCVERWRPSIYMCREMSRITLEIVDIRVERLQDISEADALAEGVAVDMGSSYHVAGHEGKWSHATARGCMETLWDSINGRPKLPRNPNKRRYGRVKKYLEKTDVSWAANPWVWIVEFQKCV